MTALTPAELDELLRRPILARLATTRPGGWPSVVPVWIDWDGRHAWVIARAGSGYLDDVRHEPRVCLSVVDDDDPDRRVQLFCRAVLAGGPAPLDGDVLAMARRMAQRYEGEAGLDYIDASASWPRVLIKLEPERIVSWGSPDWHARYRSGETETLPIADPERDPGPSVDPRSPRP